MVVPAAMLDNFAIPSDVKSCEEQNGSKQYFVGQNDGRVTGRFSSRCSEKHRTEVKIKNFNLAEEGKSLCRVVSLARPLFSVFLCGDRKKGLDQFTGAIRPDTCERVNKLHHKYLHSL